MTTGTTKTTMATKAAKTAGASRRLFAKKC